MTNFKFNNGFVEALKPRKGDTFYRSYISSVWNITPDELTRIEDDLYLDGITPKEVRLVRTITPNRNCYCDVWIL